MHPSQECAIKGGGTISNRFIRDAIIADANMSKRGVWTFDGDFTKAYDSVEKWALQKAYMRVGIPNQVVQYLLKFTYGGESKVILPWGLTQGFVGERGVRQGEVLSPLAWCVFMDPLVCAQNGYGEGYSFENDGVAIKGTAYMDDTTWYAHTKGEIQQRVKMHQQWANYVGIKINWGKSTLMHNGVSKGGGGITCGGQEINAIGVNDNFKYLGIHLNMGEKRYAQHQKKTIHKIRTMLTTLQLRKLHPNEIKTIINENIVPILGYGMQTMFFDDNVLKELDDDIRRLVKGNINAPNDMHSSFVYANPKDLGIGITNLQEHQIVIGIQEAYIRLCAPTLEGKVARASLKSYQKARGIPTPVLEEKALKQHIPMKTYCYWDKLQLALIHAQTEILTNSKEGIWCIPKGQPTIQQIMDVKGGDEKKLWELSKSDCQQKGIKKWAQVVNGVGEVVQWE